jgi:predicted secreted protein
MAGAAHSTTVKAGGTSTAFTNEATTKVTANTVYQITDASKRIIDPNVAVTVEVDADGGGAGGYAVAAADTYEIDYLFGRVTFAADQGASALVRVSGSYLPTVSVAEVREVSVNCSRTVLDKTTFDSGGAKEKLAGLKDLSVSITGLKPTLYDNDPGAGTVKLAALFDAGTPFLLEVRPSGTGEYFRAWVVVESHDHKLAVDSLLEATHNLIGAPVQGSGQTESASFGWGT